MDDSLKGKTALVTGASRGIGRGIAERLARAGALVAVNYAENAEAARATVLAIENAGGRAFQIRSEVGTTEATARLFETLDLELKRKAGDSRLDILVNNAGIGVFANLQNTSIADFDRLFQVNVRGPFLVAQAALARLRDGGRIINISSGAARLAADAFAVYSMTKAALNMFTRLLAKEVGSRGITVNAVAPGWVATDINAEIRRDPSFVAQIEQQTALGRIGETKDIAEVVHFLASPAGAWVTGEVVEASGGFPRSS